MNGTRYEAWAEEGLLKTCDLYFEWALETDFVHVPAFLETNKSIGLLVEWRTVGDAANAARIVRNLDIPVPRVYTGGGREGGKIHRLVATLLERLKDLFGGTGRDAPNVHRVWAMTVPGVGKLEKFLRRAGQLTEHVELAMPMAEGGLGGRIIARRLSQTGVLAAVLDDGCAFANQRFRHNGKTRFLWLWNQDPLAKGAPLSGGNGPSPQANFGYGGQYSNAELDGIYPTTFKSQDEAYRDAGLKGLRRRASHGAHVTDLMVNTEPPWPSAAEPWDVVFVQFPQAGVDDPSGIWLKRHALDGLNYVLACAGTQTQHVIANISWGPQTGPHDGDSVLERGIKELVNLQAALPKPRKLDVTLPSGNSFGAQAHACIDYVSGGGFDWHVPPDGALPAFIQLWWPTGVALNSVALTITAPGAAPVVVKPGKNAAPDKSWWARLKVIGPYAKVLVVVHPTCGPGPGGSMPGPHGRWHFELPPTPGGAQADVHAYVARADHNMGARRRAKASYLSDLKLAQGRFRAPGKRDDDVAASAIRRSGTLNGMATGAATWCVAGYVAIDYRHARYSSAGPTRGGASKPDYACLTDRSPVRLGVRATGTRTGTTAVLVGTSTAAPQLARMLGHVVPPVVYVPVPPYDQQLGKGCLPAQPWLRRPGR